MKKNKLSTLMLVLVVAAVFTGFGCKKTSNSPTTTSSFAVSLNNDPTRGQYLVDKDGRTLYFFSNDYKGQTTCLTGCMAYWPYFYAGTLAQANLGGGLNLADFDVIVVNGTNQTRYKGWPLYYYAPSGTTLESAGQITGESVANWFVAKPDYTIMLANGQLVGANGMDYLSTYTQGIGNTVYFTDAKGSTLYTFTPDSFNINKFTKPDFSNNAAWPIYDTTKIVVPSSLNKSLFGSTMIAGRNQLTYNGWPLYYFGADSMIRGNNKGITIGPTPGSIWPVAVKGMNPAPHK